MSAADSPVSAITLASDTELTMSRVFDAPRELVFRAYTDPELIMKWWGPRDTPGVVDRMDVRPGGTWRFVSNGPDGTEFAFNGVYREVMPPERLVNTFEYELFAGHISVETAVFEVLDAGRTRVNFHVQFDSVEDRDGMVSSGMERGWTESMAQLDELLETLQN
ncbi:MAG TPA: SRPBCC family protein [Candidatus Dormibacteraeota bacterium]|nr:SRPBCC family protein [Candidatus Dormibacteraeota bacterium]